MIRTVIIDDEQSGIRALELLLTRFVEGVKVIATSNDPAEGIQLINDFRPDAVFLDINMPKLNGFNLLEQLTFRDFQLVFCTAHNEFGIRALRQNATAYLLKPVDIDDLKTTISAIRKNIESRLSVPGVFNLLKDLSEQQQRRIPVAGRDAVEYVGASEIVFVESDSNYCNVGLQSGRTVKTRSTLKEYEEMLCQEHLPFMRVHHSYIVNLNCITRYVKGKGGTITVFGGKKLPVSRQKKEDLLISLGIR